MLLFENRSFHEDRPHEIRLKYHEISWDILTSPREKRLHPCKAKSSFCVASPKCCCRKTFVFQHRPQEVWCAKMLPCERIFLFENGQFSQRRPKRWCHTMLYCERIIPAWKSPLFSTSPPRSYAKKSYHVNVFSSLQMANFLDIAQRNDAISNIFFFFVEKWTPKRPSTVKCLAVKRTLLGTRHPRKKELRCKKIKIYCRACLPVRWDFGVPLSRKCYE